MLSPEKGDLPRALARERVLVIAESGVDLTTRIARLHRQGYLVELLVPTMDESAAEFRARIASRLAGGERAHSLTLFVAGEPIGPHLHQLVRTIVTSMLPGSRLVLAAAQAGPFATRALSALALTVMEQAHGTDISVENGAAKSVPEKAWRRRMDRALLGLLENGRTVAH